MFAMEIRSNNQNQEQSDITEIVIESKDAVDIALLPQMPGLRRLRIYGKGIIHFERIQEFSQLNELNIGIEEPCDLSFVGAIRTLRSLSLDVPENCNIDFLETMNELQSISICGKMNGKTREDICHLEKLKNLRYVYLTYLGINDLHSIAGLTELLSLNITACKELSDISSLAGLKELHFLRICNAAVRDVAVLGKLEKLQILDLTRNDIVDISPLASLTNLTELKLGMNMIADFSPVLALKKLVRLEAYKNKADETIFDKLPLNVDLWK